MTLGAAAQSKGEQSQGPRGTHVGHADAGAEGDLALGLDGVELGKDAAGVRGECGQHLTVTGMEGKGFCDLRSGQVPPNLCLTHLFFPFF